MKMKSVTTKARLRDLEKSIAELLAPQRAGLKSIAETLIREVGPDEGVATAEALEVVFGGRAINRVPATAVVAAVRAFPIEGLPIAVWLDRLARADVERIVSAIQLGFVAGDKIEDIVRSIVGTERLLHRDGVREVSRRSVTAFVRAATIHVASVARTELFKANADLVKSEMWVATLDRRTCVRCGALDGEEFPLDSGRRPPLHLSCRCVTVPVLKAWKAFPEEFRRASKADDFTGQVPATLTYNEWLAERSAAFQDDVLGPSRGKLFRTGKIDLDGFTDRAGGELTLAELRAARPALFREVGL